MKADAIASLHAEVTVAARRLHVVHGPRLQCRKGCSSCCVDDLTIFEVEAEHIRRRHAALLATATPHERGACAFLDDVGARRIYDERPYVCQTQGLPLRWIEEHAGDRVELRDICPLNDAGPPIETLSADACWSLGPIEERLAALEMQTGRALPRTALRDLFAAASNGRILGVNPPVSKSFEPKAERFMGDKSPKAKDKSKKQHAADKNQKHAAAGEKAKPPNAAAPKKGK